MTSLILMPFKKFKLKKDDNIKDVIDIIEQDMLKQNLNIVKITLKGDYSYENVVYQGFMPVILSSSDSRNNDIVFMLISHFINKLSEEEQRLWYDTSYTEYIDNFCIDFEENFEFIYANLSGWKEFATTTSISFPLILYFKDQTYKSNRPKTDMSMFRQVTSVYYDSGNITKNDTYSVNLVTDGNIKTKAISVTRYASGMSKGLYYSDKQDVKFCGTFYYYEPESTTYLAYNTIRIYRNKYEAIMSLYREFNISDIIEVPWKDVDTTKWKYFNDFGTLPNDMKMTISEYHKLTKNLEYDIWDEDIEYIESFKNKQYIAVKESLYALEDAYDQAICNVAHVNGIDIIILTSMIGKYQIVTEILDTRLRQVSFSNLLYPL